MPEPMTDARLAEIKKGHAAYQEAAYPGDYVPSHIHRAELLAEVERLRAENVSLVQQLAAEVRAARPVPLPVPDRKRRPGLWHAAAGPPFVALCGATGGISTTFIAENVTCPQCLQIKKHP